MNAPFPMTKNALMVLRVLNGRLAGAEHRLHQGKFVRVGHGFDHDVSLRGEGTSGNSFELHLLDEIATVRVVTGKVTLLGKMLAAGESAHLPFYVPVMLGEFAIAVGDPASARWSDAQSLHSSLALVGDAGKAATGAGETPASEPATLKERLETRFYPLRDYAEKPLNWAKIGLIVAPLILIAVAAGPVYRLVSDQIAGPNQAEAVLAGAGFKGLKAVKDEETGKLFVTGTLRTDQDLSRLRTFAADKFPNAQIGVETTEADAAAAKEILTAQGIESVVKPQAVGALVVQSQFLPKDRQDELTRLLKQDLPGVSSVAFGASSALGEKDLQYFFSSGTFGLATFVNGDPAYIVTADGTRWFKGAQVPTGHIIEELGNGRIKFAKDGRIDELIL